MTLWTICNNDNRNDSIFFRAESLLFIPFVAVIITRYILTFRVITNGDVDIPEVKKNFKKGDYNSIRKHLAKLLRKTPGKKHLSRDSVRKIRYKKVCGRFTENQGLMEITETLKL